MQKLLTSSFCNLEFEEKGHKYNLDGNNLMPVSNVIERYYEEFPEDAAIKYAERYGLDIEAVKENWKQISDQACDFGHSVHNFGEMYYYNHDIKPTNNHEVALVNFWKSIPSHIAPIACETRVYSQMYEYAGTFDLLLFDETKNGAVIIDYKTNKDIFKNFKGKLMLSPFDFLLDSPYNHYQIQLSLYQIPLEDIGINIISRRIIWLKGDGTYNNYITKDFTKYLRNNLK